MDRADIGQASGIREARGPMAPSILYKNFDRASEPSQAKGHPLFFLIQTRLAVRSERGITIPMGDMHSICAHKGLERGIVRRVWR